ncbi:MAG: polyprenyl synthetase family protein [Syntrophomonadaceae bacterium]|nr:polyprenyl synthetase family protein [Syntrophomonadaceae bacterium]
MDLSIFSHELNIRKKLIEDNLVKCININAHPPSIHAAMEYALLNGGKRIRPIMVLEGAKLAGIDYKKILPTACALELIHTYSLVHDDLPAMDNDELRRGKPTCHIEYGEDIAILTGDALLTLAFELLASNSQVVGINNLNVVKVISEVANAAGSQGMIGGQVIDLASEGKSIDYDSLLNLHSLKTGKLFEASLVSGAILGDMGEEDIKKLRNYAYHYGLAFQITDDILDVTGDVSKVGKPIGSDEKNFKTTYPTLFGIEKSKELAKVNIDKCIDNLNSFGEKADFLKSLAIYTLLRNN